MYSLADLAQRFGLELVGDGRVQISGVCALSPGKPDCIGFLANPRHRGELKQTAAAAIVVSKAMVASLPRSGLVAADPHLAFARIARLFDPESLFAPGIHERAAIAPDAQIGAGCHVAALAVIESGAVLGPNTYVGSGSVIGAHAQIGAGSRLESGVRVGARVVIGARAHLHPGAVIGSRGFGLARSAQGWEEVPQLGTVVIGDDVEIGANTTVDRGALDDTVIESGVKIDNLVQIAHNCRIGAHTAIAAQTGIAGSTHIGSRCMIGGAVAVGGHLRIADDIVVLGGAMVTKSLTVSGMYSSVMPADDARVWRKTVARLRRLEQTEQRLKAVEVKLSIQSIEGEGAAGEDDV